MFALSLNHKRAELSLRERFALEEPQVLALLEYVAPAVYLSTCNRCELYGTGNPYAALEALGRAVRAEGAWKESILIYTGERAVRHLFRVAAGLDSMVLGEDEILGQLKRSFFRSQERGLTDYTLNTVFKAAVTAAKRVKSETRHGSVSVATLAASACQSFGGRQVLLIGAGGDIGGKVLKNLQSCGGFDITAVTRSGRLGGGITAIPYARRYDHTDQADIIISATSSPHFTLTKAALEERMKTEKPRLLLDLAVPRDMDSELALLPGVTLRTIDDFQTIAEQNQARRRQEISAAEDILTEEMDGLRKELAFHDLLPNLHFSDGLMKFIYQFRDTADGPEFESFAAVLRRMEEST